MITARKESRSRSKIFVAHPDQAKCFSLSVLLLKGTVAPDIAGPFLARMDCSGREKEPLPVFFPFFCYFLDFWRPFKRFEALNTKKGPIPELI